MDQLNRQIELQTTPKRIISVVPSQTELLYDLGLRQEVIGITKFCVHPKEWSAIKYRIGGTKNLQVDRIKNLEPDLIIANKEENVQKQIEVLAKDFPVWVSDVQNLNDAQNMILSIGELVGKKDAAIAMKEKMAAQFATLQIEKELTCVYLIWQEPFMSVGADTFIHQMLQQCGFQNMLANEIRYPTITESQLIALKPQLVLLSSEPYPFKQKHIAALQQLLPSSIIKLVDGEMFSWYGSRLLHAPKYFQQLMDEIAVLSS
jgi:ABC-type Fe3+-hydroxamate transport system substrate-binding protein